MFSIFFCFRIIFRKVFAILLFCNLLLFTLGKFSPIKYSQIHTKNRQLMISGMSFCFSSSLFYDMVTNRISFCCHCLISFPFFTPFAFISTYSFCQIRNTYLENISVFREIIRENCLCNVFYCWICVAWHGIAWRGLLSNGRIWRINESFLLKMA